MMIHRGEAWLDAGHCRTSDAPNAENVANALAINLQFDQRPEIRPEEVLATAHAASYCLTLWNRLKQAGLEQALHQQTAVAAHLHLEIRHGLDEVRQAREAVVARGEAGHRLGALAELRQRRIAFFVALRGLSGIPVRLEPHLHA